MFERTVVAVLMVNGEEVRVSVRIGCTPNTPDSELIRRAGNILRAAANDARYEVK